MSNAISHCIYDVYAQFYDIAENLFRKRIARAVHALDISAGQRVLDIGIGTGISLGFFPDNVHVTGVDRSVPMLTQAYEKLNTGHVRENVSPRLTSLVVGDALNLPFPDHSFDRILMSHVISTVADPRLALAEALRVCRNRGRIVLVNHFRSRWSLASWVETALDPVCRHLGWRADLGLHELLDPFNVQNIHHTGHMFDIILLEREDHVIRQLPLPSLRVMPSRSAAEGLSRVL